MKVHVAQDKYLIDPGFYVFVDFQPLVGGPSSKWAARIVARRLGKAYGLHRCDAAGAPFTHEGDQFFPHITWSS